MVDSASGDINESSSALLHLVHPHLFFLQLYFTLQMSAADSATSLTERINEGSRFLCERYILVGSNEINLIVLKSDI